MLLAEEQIVHSVIFCLKHEAGSAEESRFLEDGRRILTSIPEVTNFQIYRQVSSKNNFDFGFSMVFNSQAAYDAYNAHPLHVQFVQERWVKEVADFLEIDYSNYAHK